MKNKKEMPPKGSMPFGGKPPKRKIDGKVFKRVIVLLFKSYPVLLPLSLTCIAVSAIVSFPVRIAFPCCIRQPPVVPVPHWSPCHSATGWLSP